MKYASLMCLVVLSAAVAIGCGEVEAGTAAAGGSGPVGGTGGGTGGTGGGLGEGACTDDANQETYSQLEYTDRRNMMTTGSASASAIASDCIFGPTTGPSEGCGAQAGVIIGGDTSEAALNALAGCVEICLEVTVGSITDGDELSEECVTCYGDSVVCSAANCTAECAADPAADQCVQCRADNNCTGGFNVCSGLGGGGGGGTGGDGGGTGEGACTDEANQTTYGQLEYTSRRNVESTGVASASDIGADCIFGPTTGPSNGCGAQAGVIIGGDISQPALDALALCVEDCMSETIVSITGSDDLSPECLGCYGESVVCGAAFCTAQCAADPTADQCIACRDTNGCLSEFDDCSGLNLNP